MSGAYLKDHQLLTLAFVAALLCFDFTLTFASECDRIWRRRVTGATVLFLLVRYTTVLLRVVVTLELILSRLSGGVRAPQAREHDLFD